MTATVEDLPNVAAKRVPDVAGMVKRAFKGQCPYPYGAANDVVHALVPAGP